MTFREIVSQTLCTANLGTKIPRDDAANLQIYSRQEIDSGGTQTTESADEKLLGALVKNSSGVLSRILFNISNESKIGGIYL